MEKKNLRVTLEDTRESMNIINDPRRSFSNTSAESLLFLVLDCYSYTAGENVTGEILMLISEPIPNSKLKIHSKGFEKVSVFDSKDRSLLVEETKEVYTLDSLIESWNPSLSPGHYVFPFTFKLPAFSPSTFYYSGEDSQGNYLKVEVIYQVSVKLELNESPGLHHMRFIYVKNLATLEKPGPSIEATAEITGCCFSNLGITDFSLSVGNTDHCQVNGEVMYKLIPNNSKCNAPINQVIGSVLMELEVTTHKGNFRVLKKLSEIDRATWISAFTSLIYERDFEYHSELKHGSEELNPGSNKSSLFRCEYFVEMRVFYNIAFQRNPVIIRLPFHVNPRIVYRKQDPALPYDWKPVESTIFNFLVDKLS
jgi:hypothetical protein